MTKKFEILCVTMNQDDFSKIDEMNIRSNVIFANQANRTAFEERGINNHTCKMITTDTRGVGINRNLALMYADAEICLFADDDVKYVDELEEIVVGEFEKYPQADIFIFHLDSTDKDRQQKKYKKTRKCHRFEKMPWGGVRIAVRLASIKKANVWFTTLFGGGCIFPSGEDSMWLMEAKRKGLKFFVSNKTIGTISFDNSSWYSGADEKFYYGKGAFYQATHKYSQFIWRLYFAFRTWGKGELSFRQKMYYMKLGAQGFKDMQSYNEYQNCK